MKKFSKLLGVLLMGLVASTGVVYADDTSSSSTSDSVNNNAVNTTSGTNGSTSATQDSSSIPWVATTWKCEADELKPGSETTCTLSVTPNAALAASTNTKILSVKIVESEYLTIGDNITVSSSSGFTITKSSDGKDFTEYPAAGSELAYKQINLTYPATSSLTADKAIEVFSFTVKLSKDAETKLSAGDICGNLCIYGVFYDSNNVKTISTDNGSCFMPKVILETCTGTDCNPTTGEFTNYIVIGTVSAVALVGLAVASKKKKFYNV